MKLPKALLESAKKRRLIPFIGAGFSRVFKLPTHSQLMDETASHLGFDPLIASLYGDFLQLAEYIYIQDNGMAKLRSRLDKVFNADSIDIKSSQQHMLLSQLKAPAIYTTNWDNLIERAFDASKVPYNRIASVDDFSSEKAECTSIVKLHGDFSSADSDIVFTERSYFQRLDFSSPLDIRLRSDMLGHVLLFLGHSLTDINIRYMWFKLQSLLSSQESVKRRDPFAYIVSTHRNPVFEEICKHARDISVICMDGTDPETAMIDILTQLNNNK